MTLAHKQQYTIQQPPYAQTLCRVRKAVFGCFGEVAEYAVESLLINNEFKTDCRQAEPCRYRRLRYRSSIL